MSLETNLAPEPWLPNIVRINAQVGGGGEGGESESHKGLEIGVTCLGGLRSDSQTETEACGLLDSCSHHEYRMISHGAKPDSAGIPPSIRP